MQRHAFAVLGAALLLGVAGAAHGFQIIQITDNGSHDLGPDVSNGDVAWRGGGLPYDVFLWDGATTFQITSTPQNERPVAVSDSNLAWTGFDGDDEIFFWDGSTTQVTTNTEEDDDSDVSGSNVVWSGFDGSDREIYLWDGVSTTQITTNSVADKSPSVSGPNIVWQGCDGGTGSDCTGGDWEIYRFNGTTTTQITDNTVSEFHPAVSGPYIVWSATDGTDSEIYRWRGSTTQITDNTIDDFEPDVSGENVVWRTEGPNEDIYLWEAGETTQITSDLNYDAKPAIHGCDVVWEHDDGLDFEIQMLTEGATLTVQARHDVPGVVSVEVEAISVGGIVLRTCHMQWTHDDNSWGDQVLHIPELTAQLRFTYYDDRCDSGCPEDTDADRNFHLDYFTVTGLVDGNATRDGQSWDETGGNDPMFAGCDDGSLDGRSVTSCGNNNDWALYVLSETLPALQPPLVPVLALLVAASGYALSRIRRRA